MANKKQKKEQKAAAEAARKRQEEEGAAEKEKEKQRREAAKQGKQKENPEEGESSRKNFDKQQKDLEAQGVKFSKHAKSPKFATVEDDPEDGEDGGSEAQDPNAMDIDQEDVKQQEELLESAEQPKAKMDQPPVELRKLIREYKDRFEEFWEKGDTTILDNLEDKILPKLKKSPYCPPLARMRDVKAKCIKYVTRKPTDAKAWHKAFETASKFKQQIIQSGLGNFNIDPPDGWIEYATGLKPPGSDESSDNPSSSSDDDSSNDDSSDGDSGPDDDGDSVDEFDADADDSIEALAKASGAAIPLISRGDEILAYSERGNNCEVLVKQGKGNDVRYRMMSSKGVSGFNKKKPGKTPNLAEGQRGLEKDADKNMLYKVDQVKAIKGVAWKDETAPDENPLDILTPEFNENRLRFPVTRVLVKWDDAVETWETRSTLRNLYGKGTADRLIYQRAGIQEQRYRRSAKLPPLRVKKVDLPSQAPAASSIGGSQRWQARSSTPGSWANRSTKSSSRSAGGSSQRVRFQRDPDFVQSLEIDAIRDQLQQLSVDTAKMIREQVASAVADAFAKQRKR